MSAARLDSSAPWFRQAESDRRTAEALFGKPLPMDDGDVGCHVVAMCAQAIEKSIKGYVILNGATPAMNHRPDKYVAELLLNTPLLHYRDHYRVLSDLFDLPTRGAVSRILDFTPGALGSRTDLPNTEYPWTGTAGISEAPAGSAAFGGTAALSEFLVIARRVTGNLRKLWIAVDRGTAL